jgi:hypothetical protein
MNQAASFGLLGVGGLAVVKALTGASWADVVKGHPGAVASSGATLATTGVAGAGAAIASAATPTPGGTVKASQATGSVAQALGYAKSLEGSTYVYGGGHGGSFSEAVAAIKSGGLDCSAYVSQILGPRGLGVLTAADGIQSTATLPKYLDHGVGKQVTVYIDPSEHTIIDIDGDWFAAQHTGTKSAQITPEQAQATIAEFGGAMTAYHPAGY